jgi:hypothetical protein
MVMLEIDKDLARIGAGWYGPAIGSHQARRAFRCRSGIRPSLRRARFGIAQLHGESTLQAHFRAANHQVPRVAWNDPAAQGGALSTGAR